MNNNTKLISLSHVSNVLGSILNITQLVTLRNLHSPKGKILLDACQSMSHKSINVSSYPFNEIDFIVFMWS